MDVKRHAHIYDDLLKLDIELNFQDVPTPAYIQEKIIQCNKYQLKAERFFIEITRDLAIAERMFTVEKLNISSHRMSLLTNNESIKNKPTGKEREAAADEMLEQNYRDLLKLENDVNDLKSILSAIRQKQTTLKSTNADIKSLQKLMEQQINRLNIGHPDDPDIKHLSDAFREIDKLEEEFEIDEVESSVEISQSEDSEDISEEDSVIADTIESPELSVDLEGSIGSEESIVVDEKESGPVTTGNAEEETVSTEDIGEITVISETSKDESSTDSKQPKDEDSQSEDDIEDELASILTEYEPEVYDPEDASREDEEQISTDETEVQNDSVTDAGDSVETPDIEIDDEIESDVESQVSEPPKLDVDLSDLGFDLDIEDSIPETTKTTSRTENKPTKETGNKATDKKKKDPPEEKRSVDVTATKTKKAEVEDINLDDILDSL